MSPLESRKRLLVAESELKREQLSEELPAMAQGVRSFAQRIKTMFAWASAGALPLDGVTALRRTPTRSGDAKPFWLQKILKGAWVASTLWFAFRPAR